MVKICITKNSKETQKLAENIARKVLVGKKGPVIIALAGELGAGKTTFTQGFAKGLGIREKVLSPTFVILKRFKLNNLTIKQFNNFYHFDCYRINNPKEILDLGWKEIIGNSENIVIVEWAGNIKKIMPENAIWISFCHGLDENKRKIKI